MANRWTYYIGKDGKILAIDKAVKPPTSAEDMAAKLGELGVEPTKYANPVRIRGRQRDGTSWTSNSFGHSLPVTNRRSPAAS